MNGLSQKRTVLMCFEERCPNRRALEMVDDVIFPMMTTQLIVIKHKVHTVAK